MKTIEIHGKQYTPASERIKYFHENYPLGSITTDILFNNESSIIIKATVIPDIACPERSFTGIGSEVAGTSMINKTSHVENCETSAVARALGFLGIGIIDSVASADEVVNAKAQQKVSKPKEVVSMDNHIRSEIEKDLNKMLLELVGGDKPSLPKAIQVYTSFKGKDGKVKSCNNLKDMSDTWLAGLLKKVKKDYDNYNMKTEEVQF